MYIDQLSRITGVSTHAIRQYEQMELIPPNEGENGYFEPHVHAIKLIKLALSSGLSLREIIHMISAKDGDEFSRRQQNSLARLNVQRDQLDPNKTGEFTKIEVINSIEKELTNIQYDNAITSPYP